MGEAYKELRDDMSELIKQRKGWLRTICGL